MVLIEEKDGVWRNKKQIRQFSHVGEVKVKGFAKSPSMAFSYNIYELLIS